MKNGNVKLKLKKKDFLVFNINGYFQLFIRDKKVILKLF
jgi:hypothetical protein